MILVDMYLAGDGCDEDSDFGPDPGAGVANGGNALGLDENGHLGGELGEVCIDVVIEDQAGQHPGGVILIGHLFIDVLAPCYLV